MLSLLCLVSLNLLIFCSHSSNASPIKGKYNNRDAEAVDSSNNNYTFVVAVERICDGSIVCTGSLISDRHVLVAKYCLHVDALENLQVSIGNYDRKKGTKYDISEGTSFLRWANEKGASRKHRGARDVAVMTLAKAVTDSNVHYARLTDKRNRDFYGMVGEILGWGETDFGQTNTLRKGHVEILTPHDCKLHVKAASGQDHFRLNADKICSFSYYKERAVIGDFGGPLVVNNELIGININFLPTINRDSDNENAPNLHLGIERYRPFLNNFINSTTK